MYTRITSKMMMTTYKSTLAYTASRVDSTGQAVTNERKYQKDSESPVNATRAYQYRREMTRAETYQENTKSMSSLLSTRESVVMTLSSQAKTAYADVLGGVTGTSSPESRLAYAQQLEQLQKSAIQSLNSSYGGQFLFGGSSTEEVPFALEEDGTVNFRGIPVDGLSKTEMAQYKSNPTAELTEKLNANMEKLKGFAKETQYVDLGFGLQIDADGSVNGNTAYNSACNAISFLGFGTNDGNGESQNMVQLLGDMAEALKADTFDDEGMQKLTDNFSDSMTSVTIELTQLGSDENFMETNLERLTDVITNLTAKTNSTEYITEAQAITNFEQAQYAYKAALQIGSQILSQSFLDYMR